MFLIIIAVILIIYKLYNSFIKNDYWKNKNVPYLKPKIFFGNFMDYFLFKNNFKIVESEICEQFPNEPYIGAFYGTKPVLIVKDPKIIKIVLAQDFYYFSGRGNTDYCYKEPITTNLFFNGGDKWKVLRQNLSPLFTSAKLKIMFPLIKKSAEELETFLDEEMRISNDVNVKATFARYGMECIMNCAFGLKPNTLQRDIKVNPFTQIGQTIFDTSITRGMKIIFRDIWPSLFYGLGFKLFDKRIGSFFDNIFTEVAKSRPEGGSSRNDFIDLILNWKKENYIFGDSLSNYITGDKKIEKIKVDEELLAGQCTLFFSAGFETTSTTLNFLLFELAKNKKAQARVIEEVDAYFEKHNGVIEYECVGEMPYVEACIEETLRIHPVLGVVPREVMDNYTLPTGVRLDKGVIIHIPVYHIHRNPEYFPDPMSFRPERFFGDEKKNVTPYTFMPFGEGLRICIGIRFARMVMYAALLTIFKKYRIDVLEDTPLVMKYKPVSLVTQVDSELHLKFVPR